MQYKKTLALFLILTSILGCEPTVTTKRTPSTLDNTNTGVTAPTASGGTGSSGVGSGSGSGGFSGGSSGGSFNNNCYAQGIGQQASDYYNFDEIVQVGLPAGVVAWSSATDARLSNQQNLFITDSRLNVRILAKPSPGKGSFPGGAHCNYAALPYTKLQVKVRLRSPNSSSAYRSYTFNNIPVDGCSNVFEFNPPSSNQPWILEIMDVKWDYSCIAYTQGGFPDVPQCPWDYVWTKDCYELSIQWATDHTRDIPH